MIDLEPIDVRLTSFNGAEFAYRGISRQQRHNLGYSNDRLRPEVPLQKTAEMTALFYRDIPLEHVLTLKKKHFCSFSLWYDVAVYYATHGEPEGFVVKVRLPEIQRGIKIGSEEPVVWEGNRVD
jgi:hypothetical protein